jgi:hypothetical protein
MTWGGTKIVFIKIVTLETGDMAQKVFFGAFWTHSRQITHCVKKKGRKDIFRFSTRFSTTMPKEGKIGFF